MSTRSALAARGILLATLTCAGVGLSATSASAKDFEIYGTNQGALARDE